MLAYADFLKRVSNIQTEPEPVCLSNNCDAVNKRLRLAIRHV